MVDTTFLLITTEIILALVVGFLLYQLSKLSFKVGYYEQLLRLHKSKFSPERYDKIQKIMRK